MREEVKAMRCPICKSENIKVYHGRNEGDMYKRYRRCLNCFRTFQTVETVEPEPKKTHSGGKKRAWG